MNSVITKLVLASLLSALAISCRSGENAESRNANSSTPPVAPGSSPLMSGSGKSGANENANFPQSISGADAAAAQSELSTATRELLGEMLRGEGKAVGERLTEDYRNTRPDGTVEDKAGYLANLKPFPDYNGFIYDRFKVERLEGDAATVSGLVQVSNEKKESFYSRFKWTFVKRQGKWLLQSSQNSEMADKY